MRQWLADDWPLAASALLALAIGGLGDAYLCLGVRSSTAFSAAALAWPAAAALCLTAIVALGLAALAPAPRPLRLAAAAFLLPLLGVLVVLDCLPPIARDELTHHLAIPALYVEAKRIVEVPFADQSYYPMLLEMFYTPLLGWLPDNAPKFLHLLFALASAAVVAMAAAREAGPAAGLAGLGIILATPVVAGLAGSAYVDLGLLFYSSIALVTLLRWFETGTAGWFVVSALSAGFACTAKYNGMLVLILLSAGTVFFPARQRRVLVVMAPVAYVAVALVAWAPWLVKNMAQTGNPLYPMFHGILGGRALPAQPSVDVFSRRRVIYGESWLEIAAIPLRIFTTGREGVPSRFDGVLTPLFLLGIAAACRRSAARGHRLLLAFAAAYFGISFFQITLRARYIIPIVPALALITAPALVALGQRRRGFVAAAVAGAVLFSAGHMADKWQQTDPLAYLSGTQDRTAYVARFVPELPVIEYANAHLPSHVRVYLAFLGTRSYYVHRPFTYDTYFSGTTLREYVETSRDAGEVRARFRDQGITHMIVSDSLLVQYLGFNLSAAGVERWRTFADEHLTQVTTRDGVSLYEIG